MTSFQELPPPTGRPSTDIVRNPLSGRLGDLLLFFHWPTGPSQFLFSRSLFFPTTVVVVSPVRSASTLRLTSCHPYQTRAFLPPYPPEYGFETFVFPLAFGSVPRWFLEETWTVLLQQPLLLWAIPTASQFIVLPNIGLKLTPSRGYHCHLLPTFRTSFPPFPCYTSPPLHPSSSSSTYAQVCVFFLVPFLLLMSFPCLSSIP